MILVYFYFTTIGMVSTTGFDLLKYNLFTVLISMPLELMKISMDLGVLDSAVQGK